VYYSKHIAENGGCCLLWFEVLLDCIFDDLVEAFIFKEGRGKIDLERSISYKDTFFLHHQEIVDGKIVIFR
jgi:uncharacterized protein YheU (UPF0270 family)